MTRCGGCGNSYSDGYDDTHVCRDHGATQQTTVTPDEKCGTCGITYKFIHVCPGPAVTYAIRDPWTHQWLQITDQSEFVMFVVREDRTEFGDKGIASAFVRYLRRQGQDVVLYRVSR